MRRLAVIALAFCAFDVHAQDDDAGTPAFDRPGIGFSTSTLPSGGVALELGLPSLQRDRDDAGVLATRYSTDINLRVGVSEYIELQAFSTPWNHLRTDGQPSTAIAGAGVTWMVAPTVQLDASFDVGLDDASPDLLAGLGVAFYFQ